MATTIRTTYRAILANIQSHLSTTLEMGTNLIIPTTEENPIPLAYTQQIYLRPDNPSPRNDWIDSQGRYSTVISRPLHVILYSYLGVNPIHDQTNLLLDETNGHLVFEDRVLEHLIGYFPADEEGNHLTLEELKMAPSLKPHPPLPDKGWARSIFVFAVQYTQDLTQTC